MDLITPSFGLIFWQTVTLLAVLFILAKFAWRPILAAIHEREESIAAALQAAEKAREEVMRVEEDKQALMKTAHKEREQIITEAIATKNAIVAEATSEAERASEKVIEHTCALLEREKETARGLLRNEVAVLSIQIAEKLLQNELQHNTQEELVQKLIKKAHWA